MSNRKTLLIVAHTPSVRTEMMLKALISGTSDSHIENIEVRSLSPIETQPEDIKLADALIIGTTENFGYIAGLTKDFLERCYYECIDDTEGLPFAFYIRAGHDGTGAKRALESITSGLKWKLVREPLICRGEFKENFLDQCEELGLSMAASLEAEII